MPRSFASGFLFLQVLKPVNVSVLQRRHVTVRSEPGGRFKMSLASALGMS